jgi:hypothetical protein
MTPRSRGLDVLDHVVHVVWTVFAYVGMFTVVRVSGDGTAFGPLGWPIGLGLVMGLLTAPFVLRRVRPQLHRRFPDWFENPAGRN